MDIHKIFKGTKVFIVFLAAIYTFVYVNDTIHLKKEKLIQVQTHNMTVLKDSLDKEINETKGIAITEIHYDETHMKQWIYSVIQGIYDGDHFRGVIGIDILIDSYFALFKQNTLNKTGG